jgi:hypothetical protein
MERDFEKPRFSKPLIQNVRRRKMKRLILALLLVSGVAFAAHITVDVTPDSVKKYDLDVKIKSIEQTIKEGDKPTRVTGHSYQVTVKSKKVNLKNCNAFLHVENGEGSYLHVALQRDPLALKDGFIFCTATFSPDYLDKASIIVDDFTPGSSFSYKLKIKDWIKTSEPKDALDKK